MAQRGLLDRLNTEVQQLPHWAVVLLAIGVWLVTKHPDALELMIRACWDAAHR